MYFADYINVLRKKEQNSTINYTSKVKVILKNELLEFCVFYTMQSKLIPKENSDAKVNLQSNFLKVIFGMFGLNQSQLT